MRLRNLKNITKQQQQILDGLTQIDKEISGFYQDALLILSSDCVLGSKVNLVAHLSREIDGGFRNIYAPKSLHKQESKDGGAHKASILIAMGFKNKEVSDEWFKISTQFASYAHRHGLETRTLADFNALWLRYEKVLIFLVGSNYAFQDRVNQLTSMDPPTDDMLRSLTYFFKDPQKEFLFYKTLQKPGWLIPLKEKGFFDLNAAFPSKVQPEARRYPEWLPLRYLDNIAALVNPEQEKVVVEIIREFQARIIAGTLFLDEYTIYLVCRIMASLPDYIFGPGDAEFLAAFGNYWIYDHKMHESELSGELLEKMLKVGSAEGVIHLVTYSLGYEKQETKIEGFEEHQIYTQVKFKPNIGEAYQWTISHHIAETIKIGGLPLLKNLAEVLRRLASDQPSEIMSLPSIEDSEQRQMRYNDWTDVLPDFISKGTELLTAADKDAFTAALLQENDAIFIRIAFHLIRLDYEALGHLFWKYISERPLDAYFPIHELYLLTRQHSLVFSDQQFILYLNWVDQMTFESDHLSAEERATSKIYRKRRYLDALKPAETGQAALLAAAKLKYEAINKFPLEHPEYDTYSTFSNGYDLPENALAIKKQNIAEQVELLQAHQDTGSFDTTGSGLGILMSNYIIEEPEKYLNQLELILSVRPQFLKQVISALVSVLKNDAIDDWKLVVEAIDRRVQLAGFETEDKFRHTSQTMTEVAEFYLNLSRKNEKYQFTRDNLAGLIGSIIYYLSLETYKTPEPIGNDLDGYHLNSMPGKLFEALINFCRLWSQQLAAEEQHRLPPEVITYFDQNLARTSEKDKGFSLGVGYHFGFILYADREWCDNHAGELFSKNNPLHKNLTLSALLSPYNHIYQSVINYLKEHGLNSYAISQYTTDSAQLTRLVKYALVEYFEIDHTVLTEPAALICQLIAHEDTGQFEKMITVAIGLEIVPQELLLAFWKRMYQVSLKDSVKFAGVLKNLTRLMSLLSELNGEFITLVESSLSYLTGDPVSYAAVRSLLRLSGSDPEKAGQLVLQIWQQTQIRIDVSKELLQFVEGLYLKGLSSLADDLCIHVAKTGEMGLKSIYDSYKLKGFN
jgi:hypothetical protein